MTLREGIQFQIDDTLDMISLKEVHLKEHPSAIQRLVLEGLYVRLRKLQGELADEERQAAASVLPLEPVATDPNRAPAS